MNIIKIKHALLSIQKKREEPHSEQEKLRRHNLALTLARLSEATQQPRMVQQTSTTIPRVPEDIHRRKYVKQLGYTCPGFSHFSHH